MKENWLKKQMREGRTVRAMWLEQASPAMAEMAVYAGWKAILIDNEHGTASLETTAHLLRAVESAGGHPIVRVPWNDQVYLKRILDLGAQSLMIPMICDGAAAKEAVDACRYPPLGKRGFAAPNVRASGYGYNADYRAEAADELFLMAQIEHKDAIGNIGAIAIDGVDMLFLGPYDMAGSIGKLDAMTDGDAVALHAETETRIMATGKLMGSVMRPGKSLTELVKRGHRFLVTESDVGLFVGAARAAAAKFDTEVATTGAKLV